MTKIKGQTSLA